jgi:HPt (histidine-containing phosphotransfer) domain-containing protein
VREWNRERLLRDLDGDEGMLRELVTLLCGLIPAFREALGRAVAAEDHASLARITHKMHSALRHFGVDGMAALALEVEQQSLRPPHAPAFVLATQLAARLDPLEHELHTYRSMHRRVRRTA